jgi:hypothetical protein
MIARGMIALPQRLPQRRQHAARTGYRHARFSIILPMPSFRHRVAMRHHSRVSSAPHLTSSGVDARLAVSSRGSNARLAVSFEDAGRDDEASALPAKAEATALHRAPTPADPPSSSEDAAAVADETKGECQRASYER